MFADIKTAGCVQVPEVLLEQTPIGLRCWEREACGPGGGGALVGHGQVLGGMSMVSLPGWLTLGGFFFFFFFFSMTILQNAWIQQIASIASYMMYPD